MPISLGLVAVGGLFLPDMPWFTALTATDASAAFLGQLWQVIAATASLAAAVVFFVFQGLSAGRPTAMRDSGVAGPFQLVVYLGVTALLVIGLVLLGVGSGAPARWSATWAVVVAGASLVSVAAVFGATLHALDQSRLHRRRLKLITRQAYDDVRDEARLRLGIILLDRYKDALGFSVHVLGISRSGEGTVRAPHSGVVRDVRLRRLQTLARRAREYKAAPPALGVYIGRDVAADTVLVVAGDARLEPDALRVVRLGKSRAKAVTLDLRRITEELHDEAIQAARGARVSTYGEIAEAQAELLLAIPEAWARDYGQKYTSELASGIFPLRLGPVDHVSRNIHEQTLVAIAAGVRELALDAAYQPIAIASRAARVGAVALVSQMMSTVQGIISIPDSGDLASLVREHSWLNLTHLVEYVIGHIAEDTSADIDRRREAVTMLEAALEVTARVAKSAIEAGNIEFFRDVTRFWEHLLEFWLRNQSAPWRPESPEKELADGVRAARDDQRFATACWLIHRLRADPTNTKLLAMLDLLRPLYSDPDVVVSLAMRTESSGSDQLGRWLMSDLPSGEVHVIDTRTPTLFAAALLIAGGMIDGSKVLDPTDWVARNETELTQTLDQLVADQNTAGLVSRVGDVAAAVAGAKRALSEAAIRQRESDDLKLREAVVPEETKDRFFETVREAWQSGRSSLAVLMAAGMQPPGPGTEVPAVPLSLRPRLESKSWATDHIARELGSRLAAGENRNLYRRTVEAIKGKSALEVDDDDDVAVPVDLGDRADAVVQGMRAQGYEPTLILHGSRWEILRALAVDPMDDVERSDPPIEGVRGKRGGLLVVETALLDPNDVVVVDASAWAEVQDWTNVDDHFVASLTTYTQDEAKTYLDEWPATFGDGLSKEEEILEMQRRIRVDVSVPVQLVVKDPAAARVVSFDDERRPEDVPPDPGTPGSSTRT